MDKEKINLWISKPWEVQLSDLEELDRLIKKYPYFQALKALQTKLLKENHSHLYPEKENQLALHTLDRSMLHQFLNQKFSLQNNAVLKQDPPKENPIPVKEENVKQAAQKDAVVSENKTIVQEATPVSPPTKAIVPKSSKKKKKSKALKDEPKKKIGNKNKKKFSYSEWLKRTQEPTPVAPSESEQAYKTTKDTSKNEPVLPTKSVEKEPIKPKEPVKRHLENPIIDAFIKESPKITPLKKEAPFKKIPKEALKPLDSGDLMTETLAKIYLKQKNYTKAEQAYKILILKNPQKSGYFADQIRLIKDLRENKDEL